MDLVTTDKSLKSFWERTEGTWGMAILALLGVGGLFLAKALLPTIIAVLTMGVAAVGQLIMLSILCAALAAILYILFATNLPKLVGYWFKAGVRRLTGVFVAVYPIEIMKEFISKMIGKKNLFSEKKTDIKKQERVLAETIEQNERERKDALARVQAAQKRNMPMEVELAARQAGRLQEINERHNRSLSQITALYTQLERVEKVCDFKIRDMQDQVKMLDQDLKLSKATKSAIGAAAAILRGTDSDQELYDAAVEYVVEDYRSTMGLVDDFMASTESILNGVDLQNGMWEEKALAQIASLNEKEQMLLGRTPQAQVLVPSIPANVVEAVPLPASDYGSKYFN